MNNNYCYISLNHCVVYAPNLLPTQISRHFTTSSFVQISTHYLHPLHSDILCVHAMQLSPSSSWGRHWSRCPSWGGRHGYGMAATRVRWCAELPTVLPELVWGCAGSVSHGEEWRYQSKSPISVRLFSPRDYLSDYMQLAALLTHTYYGDRTLYKTWPPSDYEWVYFTVGLCVVDVAT